MVIFGRSRLRPSLGGSRAGEVRVAELERDCNCRKGELPSHGTSVLVPLSALGPAPAASGGPPCDRCTARCCRYIALEIDRPVTPRDHDQIRWYLLHEGIAVWVDEGEWYVEIRNPCRKLGSDNGCRIYETRPQLCRDYGAPESGDRCEYYENDLKFDLYFETAEQFETWSREALRKREERLRRRREAYRRRTDGVREAIA